MLIEFEIPHGRPLVVQATRIAAIYQGKRPQSKAYVRIDGHGFQVKGTLAEVREKWEKALGEKPQDAIEAIRRGIREGSENYRCWDCGGSIDPLCAKCLKKLESGEGKE